MLSLGTATICVSGIVRFYRAIWKYVFFAPLQATHNVDAVAPKTLVKCCAIVRRVGLVGIGILFVTSLLLHLYLPPVDEVHLYVAFFVLALTSCSYLAVISLSWATIRRKAAPVDV